MAASPSRLERLLQVIGEENLPVKLPESTITPVEDNIQTMENDEPKGSFSKLQSVVDFIKEQDDPSNNWWDAMPTTPQPVKQASTQQTRPAPTPVAALSGEFAFYERCGEVAPLGIAFAPFLAVTKIPCR